MFGQEKPVIALLHIRALPGDPLYEGDLEDVAAQAGQDLRALQDGGVDGVLFSNEFSMPYQQKTDIAAVSAMAYIIGRLKKEIKLPLLTFFHPIYKLNLMEPTKQSEEPMNE